MARDTCQNRNNRASGVRVLCIGGEGFCRIGFDIFMPIARVNDIRAPVICKICFFS